MAKSDFVSGHLLTWMDKAFNDPEKSPVGGLSGGCQLRPGMGLPALDAFGECAMAWVMAGLRGQSDSFPTLKELVSCNSRRVGEFSVGISRCTTALGKNGKLPSLDAMEREYAAQEDDKDRLDLATCAAVTAMRKERPDIRVAQMPIEVYGPEGGTVAVYRTVMVDL